MLTWLFGKKKVALPTNYKKLVDPDALAIIDQLEKAGFETYLVGGCVRDILLGKKPKDFDIATHATPQQVKAIVKRCFIIGKRFRIVVAKRRWRHGEASVPEHGLFPFHLDAASEKEFQITTFRRDPVVVNGLTNENVFGTPKEDALRRDFTINALFLEPVHGKIVDFVGGIKDLNERTLRVIGSPMERFKEDPIRILRAFRFVARASLKMDKETAQALEHSIPLLADAKKERMREEVLKSLKEGSAERVFRDFKRLGVWRVINPEFHKFLEHHSGAWDRLFLITEKICALPWTHPRNASPLFLLLLHDLFQASSAPNTKLELIEEDFKVSKAEREEIGRIRTNLNRIIRDPQAKQAVRFLGSDPRHHANLAPSFYVLKILADAGIQPYVSAWKGWQPIWKEKLSSIPQIRHQQHSAPSARRGRPSRRRGGRRGAGSESGSRPLMPASSSATRASIPSSSGGGGSSSGDGGNSHGS